MVTIEVPDKFLTKVSNPAALCSITCIIVFINSLLSEILVCLFRNKLIIACMHVLSAYESRITTTVDSHETHDT